MTFHTITRLDLDLNTFAVQYGESSNELACCYLHIPGRPCLAVPAWPLEVLSVPGRLVKAPDGFVYAVCVDHMQEFGLQITHDMQRVWSWFNNVLDTSDDVEQWIDRWAAHGKDPL